VFEVVDDAGRSEAALHAVEYPCLDFVLADCYGIGADVVGPPLKLQQRVSIGVNCGRSAIFDASTLDESVNQPQCHKPVVGWLAQNLTFRKAIRCGYVLK
jgi:hypothetical protein